MTLTDLLLEPCLPRCRCGDAARGGIVARCTLDTQLNAPNWTDYSPIEACSTPKCWRLIEAQAGLCTSTQQTLDLHADTQNRVRFSEKVG